MFKVSGSGSASGLDPERSGSFLAELYIECDGGV